MSLPAFSSIPATEQTHSVSRVIPGMRIRTGSILKKPALSVRPEPRWLAKPRPIEEPTQLAFGTWAVFALPTASVNGDRWRLGKEILGDFLVVGLSMFAVHIAVALGEWSSSQAWSLLRSACSDCIQHDLGITLIFGALVTLLSYSEGLFQSTAERVRTEELQVLCRSVAWATLLVMGAITLSGGGTISSGMLLATGVLATAGMYGRRVWEGHARHCRTSEGRGTRNVLIVGTGRPAREIADYLKANPKIGRSVCGFVNESGRGSGEVLGTVADLARIARARFVDEVIVTIPKDKELARSAIAEALRNHLDVRIVPDLLGFSPRRTAVERVGNVPTIPLNEEPIPEFGLMLKRLVDLVLTGVGLVAVAPLFALISLAIKLDSRGPVLYRAPRAGKKGRMFCCYKFRTMRTDADLIKDSLRCQNEREGPIFKITSDPRITRVGRILRRYSLDELPQLWNVWKGDMSLVGPRPHPLDDYQRYRLEHLRRLDVTPGITGLWQVTARRDPSFHTNMALDLEYIERWSLSRDLKIIFKTFSAVLSGSGA